MSNPFEAEPILEGFLCPICREDLKTPERLTAHVENVHSEDQDVLKSLKDIFVTAKKRILLSDEAQYVTQTVDNTVKSFTTLPVVRQTDGEWIRPQECGSDLSHYSYFRAIRTARLERFATETNKLIIRLNKLYTDRPVDPVQKKQHEQNIVGWLDGKSVNLCPNCARKFNLTRRQHHCRLCGSIMCHDCSMFLDEKDAQHIIHPTGNVGDLTGSDPNSLRICEHCLHLLQTRKDMQDSRNYRPPITVYYDKIEQIKKDAEPDIRTYTKIVNSLYAGDSIFTVSDASALREKIGRAAETIDQCSKGMLAIPYPVGSRQEKLKKTIRLSCIRHIKDNMLAIEPLPLSGEIEKLQAVRRLETERKIAQERQEIGPWFRDGDESVVDESKSSSNGCFASGTAVTSLDNWSGNQPAAVQMTDPLVEQINIIKGYIKQARMAMRFEEVETLELNLRELQQEFYNRQQLTMSSS